MSESLPGATSKRPAEKTAVVSDCGRYRYWLQRKWSEYPTLYFVLLNPSTADAEKDDPTVRKCVGFAKANGFGSITIVNLFAWRATDPKSLLHAIQEGADIVGPDGDYYLDCAAGGPVVAGWGRMPYDSPLLHPRLEQVRRIFTGRLLCVRQSQGRPWHPLYVPYGSLIDLER